MLYLDRTLPTPEANLALDEKLVAECGATGVEVLRVWEPREPFIVVGYSNRAFEGVRLDACRRRGVPVLRRHSGGGTVLQASGCLDYAVILRKDRLTGVRETNRFIMERQRQALEEVLGRPVQVSGFTDLVLDGRKFSGNAQYRHRDGILFHGTFMLDMDIGLIEELLEIPSVAPEYRQGRSHLDFLVNLGVSAAAIKEGLRRVWGAAGDGGTPGGAG